MGRFRDKREEIREARQEARETKREIRQEHREERREDRQERREDRQENRQERREARRERWSGRWANWKEKLTDWDSLKEFALDIAANGVTGFARDLALDIIPGENPFLQKIDNYLDDPVGTILGFLEEKLPGENKVINAIMKVNDVVNDPMTMMGLAAEHFLGIDPGLIGLPGMNDILGEVVDDWRGEGEPDTQTRSLALEDDEYTEVSVPGTEYTEVSVPGTEYTDITVPSFSKPVYPENEYPDDSSMYSEVTVPSTQYSEYTMPSTQYTEQTVPSYSGSTTGMSCRPMTCYDKCRAADKEKLRQCRLIQKNFEMKMKTLGCNTKCKTKSNAKTCRKTKRRKKC